MDSTGIKYKLKFILRMTHTVVHELPDTISIVPKVGDIIGLKDALYKVSSIITYMDEVHHDNVSGSYIDVDVMVEWLRKKGDY